MLIDLLNGFQCSSLTNS